MAVPFVGDFLFTFKEVTVFSEKDKKTGSLLPFVSSKPSYVLSLLLDNEIVARTKNQPSGPASLIFNEEYSISTEGLHSALILQLHVNDELVGSLVIKVTEVIEKQNFKPTRVLLNKRGKEVGTVAFSINYHPHTELQFQQVKKYQIDSGFPMRTGCRVRLYQDAHVGEDAPPPIINEGVEPYCNENTWIDVYGALTEARRFIYITGWSVYRFTRLIRRPFANSNVFPRTTLGELLKVKADEGVKVLLLLWNDKTSLSIGGDGGLMNTHDEDTRSFFNTTNVKVSLAYRTSEDIKKALISSAADVTGVTNVYRGLANFVHQEKQVVKTRMKEKILQDKKDSGGLLQSVSSEYIWSHHQKTIIVDAEMNPENRKFWGKKRVIAFVGGLDLTDGRWDTPAHYLFRTLDNEHKDDFYQKCGNKITIEYGPRQPWHDIHSRVEGAIAHDVMTNFIQRWKKKRVHELYDLKKSDVISAEEEKIFEVTDPRAWSVQLLRSIDQFSAPTLTSVEHTIQEAYINAIRSAERFLYIENQYFIGSSEKWLRNRDVGAANQIPYEIAKKICSKISENRDFSVYIVIPMFPEGIPSDDPIQQILWWQWNTMSFMIKMVYDILSKSGIPGRTVRDYLNFFCLGNREELTPNSVTLPFDPSQNFTPWLVTNSRRHQIYVHSKMMIVDDEYIIVGSANINERSMAGDRDTEIAVGCMRPADLGPRPRGPIHQFRMSLWAEHLAYTHPIFLNPQTVECARMVNDMALENWTKYTSPRSVNMIGHLMLYPIGIGPSGHTFPNPLCFPDTTAYVCGKQSSTIPNNITL